MTIAPPLPPGLLGCKAAGPEMIANLDHWARRLGGQPECATKGAFALWRFHDPLGGLRRFREGALDVWLLGDLFSADPQTPLLDASDIAAAYRTEGHAWIWRLVGQFALVLWDGARNELALYRDDSSARSLYYHALSNGGLVFSDRLDLLVACPLVPRRLSANGLHEYLRFLDISSPNTIYDAVASTEPGRLCVHGRHGLHYRERPAPEAGAIASWTLDEAAAELDLHLARAVASRIRDSDSIVTFLSGGVDSAYLCTLASAQHTGPLTALTVGFSDPVLDESAIAARIAAYLGIRHRVLRFSLPEYRAAFEELAARSEYPFADPAGLPSLLAFRAARDFSNVALDGTGADTLLGIMPARHQRIAVQYAARLPYPVRQSIAQLMARLPWFRDYRALLDFGDAEEVLIRWQGFSRRDLEFLCGRSVSLADTRFYRVFRGFPRAAHFDRYSALLSHLPDDRIHVTANLTGLRVRFPFFDPTVEQCVRAMDLDVRYQAGEHKHVLKQALARRMPRAIWDLPKHGFDFPFDALLADADCSLVRQVMDPDAMQRLGCARSLDLLQTMRGFIAGDRRQRFRVWALTVLAAWLIAHDVSA